MEILKQNAVDFIYRVFAKDCINNKLLKFGSSYYNNVVNNSFNEIIKGKEQVENPFILRLGGQCGSGKTSQLFPAIKNSIKTDNYIHLAVRLFAKNHPYYDDLIDKYGSDLIREKTNGFALLCLFGIIEKLIQNKYNILFEVTILEPEFERFIINLAKQYNYSFSYHVMSIPFEISNKFVIDRMKSGGLEKNRFMPQETLDYFYDVLPRGINEIINNSSMFNENDYFIIWNIINNKPVLITNKFNNKIIITFDKNRIFSENIVIKDVNIKFLEKLDFYQKFFK